MSSGYQAVNKCLAEFLRLPPDTVTAKLEISAFHAPKLTITTTRALTANDQWGDPVRRNFRLVAESE